MSSPFSVVVHDQRCDNATIRKNGFISCLVRFHIPCFVSKRMGFCLHCKELMTYNRALKHSKQLAQKQQVNLSRLFCPENWTVTNKKLCPTPNFCGTSGVPKREIVTITRTPNHLRAVLLNCFPLRERVHNMTRHKLQRGLTWLNSLLNAWTVSLNSLRKTPCSRNNGTASKHVY